MTDAPNRLIGRRALVTGGSRGLGREVAAALCREGADVVILARRSSDLDDAVRELEALRVTPFQQVASIPADLAVAATRTAVVRDAEALVGPLDILVNNAAVMGPIGPLAATNGDEWDLAIDVNLLAPIALMRAVLPGMCERRRGKIINISGGGATGSRPNFSAYASAKTALVRATEIAADEVRDAGIDINAVAPGAMNTRLLDHVLAAGPSLVGTREYERALVQAREGGTPPALAAALIVFLASPGSDGITGRLLSAVWDPGSDLPAKWADLKETDIYTLRRIVPTDRGRA
jgi:3-oxoacyl-[acyl-carrier protein] reductase